MATMPKSLPNEAISHEFHAEAYALSGHLKLPVEQDIRKQVPVSLKTEQGGHFFQRIDNYSLEGVITFQSGYTHVSGNPSKKENHGWVTLSTSVLEGLNVLDVITADRMVAQVSTEHPKIKGHVPTVTFLGTRFDNLRVGGHEVKLELDLEICGDKPEGDIAYLDDPSFLDRVERQRGSIFDHVDLPMDMRTEYHSELETIGGLKANCKEHANGGGRTASIKCSLVKNIEPIPGVKIYGNVLAIPNFGRVRLAELEVGVKTEATPKTELPPEHPESNYFTLTMIQMKMGCIGEGTASAATANANGRNKP